MRDIRKDLEERLVEIDARYSEEMRAHQLEREALDERHRSFLGYLDRMRGAINQVLMMEQKRELLEHREPEATFPATSFPIAHEPAFDPSPAPGENGAGRNAAAATSEPEAPASRSIDAAAVPPGYEEVLDLEDQASVPDPSAEVEESAKGSGLPPKAPDAGEPSPPIVTRKLVPLSDFLVTKAKTPGK